MFSSSTVVEVASRSWISRDSTRNRRPKVRAKSTRIGESTRIMKVSFQFM